MNKTPPYKQFQRSPTYTRNFGLPQHLIDTWLPILGPSVIAMYAFLARHQDEMEDLVADYYMFSLMTGMGKATVRRHCKTLLDLGFIRLETPNPKAYDIIIVLEVPREVPSGVAK